MTLTEAADELGLDASTLRRQIGRGSMRARKVGPVWTVTPREVERYRATHLGRKANRQPARHVGRDGCSPDAYGRCSCVCHPG